MEIPQLWNERTVSQVQMEDDKIANVTSSGRNIMGGVQSYIRIRAYDDSA